MNLIDFSESQGLVGPAIWCQSGGQRSHLRKTTSADITPLASQHIVAPAGVSPYDAGDRAAGMIDPWAEGMMDEPWKSEAPTGEAEGPAQG